ncbi:MAG: flagellar biosynthesis anti-sigma factor FlgM [Dehalococcoidia bacterium]|nr:MAG: flagellar biosynthesis anti-sigma factor FlgM [Dehalococcoidia bacterium]
MEISDSSAARTRRLTEPSIPPVKRQSVASSETVPPTDSIEVSAEGRSLAGVDDLARARRVAQLRARVDAGTYMVDPAELARRLAERGEA